MSVEVQQPRRLAVTWELPAWLDAWATAGGLALLLAASAVVRTRALGSGFWIDEGISVGIASHSPLAIPALLRQDGSPPLYYELLHFWMGVAGRSETATHALSLLFSLLTVPAGWWLGRSLFSASAGWASAALFALNPLLSSFAQETRMYSLVALLTLLAAGGFVGAFVMRRPGYVWLLAAALTALVYAHNWGLFFAAVAAVAWLALLAFGPDRRRLAIDGAIGLGLPALLLLPWLPSLLFQAAHTGAPWSATPTLAALPKTLNKTLAGPSPKTALLVAAATAAVMAARAPRGRWLRAGAVLSVLAGGTLMLAWVYSQHSSVWASRYLTTLLGPLLLLGGAAIARAGIAGLAALAVVAVSWWQLPPYHSVALKSNVERVAARTARHLHPGDLVLVIQPESTPVVRYYLGPRLRYATLLGRVHDPGVMDWRDGLQRLRAAKPVAVVSLVNHLRPGRRIALVRPASWAGGQHAPWTRLLKRKGRTLARELAGDHRIRQIAAIPPGERGSRSNVRAVVYVRRA